MISLTCTNCRTVLTIDDAFAGGVCRCQHCGTIQTVPSHLKRPNRAAAPGQAPGSAVVANAGAPVAGQKALYQRRARTDAGGTGLEDLADVVAGSGLSGSGIGSARLRSGVPTSSSAGAKPAQRSTSLPIILAMALALAALVGVIIWMAMGRPGATGRPQAIGNEATTTTDPLRPTHDHAPVGPSFCDIALPEQAVIYVLDRGSGTRDVFDTLKEVTYRSVQSLGGDRKFQVIFWNNGSDLAYPSGFPGYARNENLTACRRAMEETTAFGQSDAASALNKAFNNKPGVIVLATGKGLDLDSSFVEMVMGLRKSGEVKVHTFALGDAESAPLKEIAQRTGGEYRTLSAGALRQFAE